MNISIIEMPIFYSCDTIGVEYGPLELRKNNLISNFSKFHNVYDCGDICIPYLNSRDKLEGKF
jgi:arginase